MTITQATQNKGRSASFVAFWAPDFGFPIKVCSQTLLFCTYRVSGQIELFPLALNDRAELNGVQPSHSVHTELCRLPSDEDYQPGPALYVQKPPAWTAPQPKIASTEFGSLHLPTLTDGTIQFCTYRMPFIFSVPHCITTEISLLASSSFEFATSCQVNSNPKTTRLQTKPKPSHIARAQAQAHSGEGIHRLFNWLSSVRTEDQWSVIARPRSKTKLPLQFAPIGEVKRAQVFVQSASGFDASSPSTADQQINRSSRLQHPCDGTRTNTQVNFLSPNNSVTEPDKGAPSMKTLVCMTSAVTVSTPLYVQIGHGASAASVRTEQGVGINTIAWSSPLYVQKGSGSTASPVRTDLPHSLNTNAHWQAILRYTVGIVISGINRDQCPLQRKHWLSRSMTRTANQNPALRGVRHIWCSGVWRLNMT